MAAIFEYTKSEKDGQYWFHLRETGNNKIILSSTEGYTSKQGCLKGIESTRKNAPYDENYKTFQGADGKFYFTLQAGNYEPVGRSEGYESVQGRDMGVENCKVEVMGAKVKRL